jgi:WD40 repeat protein
MLQLLFKFSCKHSEGVAVTSADWNPINKDLLAVSYGDLDIDSTKLGYLMFWTLKNPSFPERIITSNSRITTCKFSNDNPNLIAVGTYDGIVVIYDITRK